MTKTANQISTNQISSTIEKIDQIIDHLYIRFPDLNPSSLGYGNKKEMKIIFNDIKYTVGDFIGCSNGLDDYIGVFSYIDGTHREFVMISRDDYSPISHKEVYAVGHAYLKKISGLTKLEDQKKALLELNK